MRSKTSQTEMKVSMVIPVIFLLPAAAATFQVGSGSIGSKGTALTHGRVSPKLDPASDQVFFRADYPTDSDASDHEPPAFTHPYPALQDSNNYDADYVKDENGDDGEWKAQMNYDLYRSRIVKRREYKQHKQQTMEKILQELEEARKRYADAKQATDETKKDLDSSIKDQGSAKDRYRKLAAGGGSHSDIMRSKDSADVEAAMEDVKREMRHLEKCRKQLGVARAKLKKLLLAPMTHSAVAPAAAPPNGLAPGVAPAPASPPAAVAAAPGAAMAPAPGPAAAPGPAPGPAAAPSKSMKAKKAHQAKKETDDELSRLEKESATADASAAEKNAQAAEAKREAAKRGREADEEIERHRIFELEKQEEAKQLKEDERELQKAAARLRRFRQAGDSDGGVYWKDEPGKDKSGKDEFFKDELWKGEPGKKAPDSPDEVQEFPPFENPGERTKSATAPHQASFLIATSCVLSVVTFHF